MGFYRLILAFMVVFHHMFGRLIFGYNIGIIAVISFLLISGYVMTALITKYYFEISKVCSFYLDRFIRIAPQFYFYSFISIIALFFFGIHHQWLHNEPSFLSIIGQLAIIPLNFYKKFPEMLMPQAWSLGLECMFYILFPYVLIFNKRFIVAGISIVIFLFALLGNLNMDLWGYRFLPGTFFIFICGSYLYEHNSLREKMFLKFIWIGSIFFLILTYSPIAENLPLVTKLLDYKRSVLAGLFFGILTINIIISNDYIKENSNDFSVGNLSYGVFLNHNLIIGSILSLMSPFADSLRNDVLFYLSVLAISTFFSYLSFKFFELPFLNLRKKRRQQLLKESTTL